jgi:hypothetical protein
VLVALLFPAFQKARRKAAILASPIAYLGADSRIHLTDPTGGLDTPLTIVERQTNCPVCHVPPVWNPSGTRIAFRMMDRGQIATGLIDPYSGEVKRHVGLGGSSFMGWLDSDRYMQATSPFAPVTVHDAGTGALLLSLQNTAVVFISPAPPSAPAPYVAVTRHHGVCDVVLLRKDLARGKRIWEETVGGVDVLEGPRIDPMGEFVAWTARRSGNSRSVQFKHVNDPLAAAPTSIGAPYQSVYFCDWTEEGTLLGNASNDGINWTLVVFDRAGQLLRRIETSTPPAEGPVASWRKYGRN